MFPSVVGLDHSSVTEKTRMKTDDGWRRIGGGGSVWRICVEDQWWVSSFRSVSSLSLLQRTQRKQRDEVREEKKERKEKKNFNWEANTWVYNLTYIRSQNTSIKDQ